MKLRAKQPKIFWKIFGYLCGFTAILLVLLWLFQVVFLDQFYRSIKTRNLYNTSQTIVKNIESENLPELLTQLARRNSICIRIITPEGFDRNSVDVQPDCTIHKIGPEKLAHLFQQTKEMGDGSLQQVYQEQFDALPQLPENMGKNGRERSDSSRPSFRHSMDYCRYLVTENGEELMVMVNTVISPVGATVEVLRSQLVYISVIMVLLSLGIAWIIARNTAYPLQTISKAATRLANGDYTVEFESTGYQEIAQLADTLNYTAGELGKVEKLRQDLIANVSHDLRTPLTMITGYAEVMRDIPGENTPENVQVIIDEANWLTTLVNDMLDLSKLQAGVQNLEVREFNLTDSIWNLLDRYTRLVQQGGYTILFQPESWVWVYADPVKITQVLYNLINNAVNYTGTDRVVRLEQTVADGWVTLSVKDSGVGIPAEQLPMIWERYYKVDKTHKRATIGSGLGLSIVRSMLELHNARYGVDSEEGKGSTFWFALPVIDPSAPAQLEP